ncbi:MAG: class I SAM-dependent methyltransferase [Myxococcota bacterium]|jgi:O-methyltransferase involved in polyketide biosynthesis|nr:class I SAM-dependent methyltransferase [Myxococcota bacterium]
MLWTLHNRASEAMRPDGILRDDEAVRIYRSIDYDYVRSFGRADGSHAARSRIFDDVVSAWMARHRGGTVVELACGLETQFSRIDDGEVRWLAVDVPEAMEVRERLLPPTERCRHVARSALDLAWMDEVPRGTRVFVTAQGLLMYFEPADVERLIRAILERFPGVELLFDAIPPWLSRKTMKGWRKTPHYTTPPMPWGVDRDALEPLLRSWSPSVASVGHLPFGYLRGLQGALLPIFARLPGLRRLLPCIVHVRTHG